jgi:prepilin-type N-terminal cleavage/methylation domain-containing protein
LRGRSSEEVTMNAVVQRANMSGYPSARAGFSLVELMVAIVVMTMAILGLGLLFVSSQRSYEIAIEEGVVTHAIRRTIEQMRGEKFSDIATLYTQYTFTVDEVTGAGSVTLHLDETETHADLGLPLDLDGDGQTDTVNVAVEGYILLPVTVTVSWTNEDGDQTRSINTFLAEESGAGE